MTKKFLLGGAIVLLMFLLLWLYVYEWRIATVDVVDSPDGKYTLKLEQIGASMVPYGASKGVITLQEEGETIAEHTMWFGTDGSRIEPWFWKISWKEAYVKILIYGEKSGILKINYDDGQITWEEERKYHADYAEYSEEFNFIKDYVLMLFPDGEDKRLDVSFTDENGICLYDISQSQSLECSQELRDALEVVYDFGFPATEVKLTMIHIYDKRVAFCVSNERYALVYSPEERPTWVMDPNEDELIHCWEIGDNWYHVVK